jgi:hypothetical protein
MLSAREEATKNLSLLDGYGYGGGGGDDDDDNDDDDDDGDTNQGTVAVADISFETPIKVIFFVGLDSTPSN